MTAAVMQCDSVWLRMANYNIAPLNSKLADRVPEVQRALQTGLAAFPDRNRNSFYEIELPTGWAYIHVRDDKNTVYLVAYSRL